MIQKEKLSQSILQNEELYTVCSKVPYLPEYEKFLMLNKYFYVACIFKAEIIF